MQLYNKIAQTPVFGRVNPPAPFIDLGNQSFRGSLGDIGVLLNIALRTLIVIAGIITVFNIVLAGYGFLTADGDPKKISDAGAKIWQSIIGLVVAAGSLVIGAIIGLILFGDANAILRVQFFIP